jgi:hypothetical protein
MGISSVMAKHQYPYPSFGLTVEEMIWKTGEIGAPELVKRVKPLRVLSNLGYYLLELAVKTFR